MTLHKFQGWETSWKDDAPVSYLLVDIGSHSDEIRSPGTCYAAMSRPHTIGDLTTSPNLKSALYLIGNDICFNRLKNVGLTKTGEPTSFVKSRESWVNFLTDRTNITHKWMDHNRADWITIYKMHIKNNSVTKLDLEKRIMTRLNLLKAALL